MPRSGINIWGKARLFSKMATSFHNPTSTVRLIITILVLNIKRIQTTQTSILKATFLISKQKIPVLIKAVFKIFSDLAKIFILHIIVTNAAPTVWKPTYVPALRETLHNHLRQLLLPILWCRSWNFHEDKVMLEDVRESEFKAKCDTKTCTHPTTWHCFMSSMNATCQAWNAHTHTHNPRMAEHQSGHPSVLPELQLVTAKEPELKPSLRIYSLLRWF